MTTAMKCDRCGKGIEGRIQSFNKKDPLNPEHVVQVVMYAYLINEDKARRVKYDLCQHCIKSILGIEGREKEKNDGCGNA